MKRVDLFRSLIYILCISLLFDYFFIVIEVTQGDIHSAFSFFDRTFIAKNDVSYWAGVRGNTFDFSPFILYIAEIVCPIVMMLFLFFTRTNKRTNLKESIILLPVACVGLFINLFLIFFMSDIAGKYFSTGTNDLSMGYFGFAPSIIKHALLIYLSFIVRKEHDRNQEETKINFSSVLFVSIMTELVLMFFFTPVNGIVHDESYESLFGYSSTYYTKFMFSPFYMMFKYKNYGELPGKIESYPYMIIMLLCYIALIGLEFYKNKKSHAISIGLLAISAIVLTIGCIDMSNSFMAHYMTSKKTNFLNCVGASYYITMFGIGLLIFLRVMQILDINLINRTKELVNADEYVKEHENIELEGEMDNEENINDSNNGLNDNTN